MATVFGKVLLISGNAEFLAERTRRRAVDTIRSQQADCEIAESSAAGLGPGELAGLTSPSLFSSASALVLTDLQDLPEQPQAELLAYVADPSPDIAVVLVHGGGAKGRGLLDKLRKHPAVTEVKVEAPKYERDVVRWLREELRALGAVIDEQAATVLVTSVGQDLRSLAGAADQLIASVPPGSEISEEVVRRYFGGRAEVRGYEVADATLDGRIDIAIERARWAATAKVAPVLITSAMAAGLRQLVKLATAPPGLRDAELAAHVGAPPFKLRALRGQLQTWDPDGLRQALDHVAQADLDVKGASADPAYAVERMVLRIAALRRRPARG
ncbi:DNA polymerase III, delta subunit [Aeromicrobium marinum DSM 15272]|uniref:DNA-directed DNA polymerase n=1 Tax=Aeromicrobium marinum DSM 15272 TaxID=585531 RepID=E2SB51_9ACTN|nr:DNA polymerase III subunit delta [Aeromicrobium marinum]EFQ83597.1 DNA polymerase III, delta subunit [Aeromicrobium marinum DSM 15272]